MSDTLTHLNSSSEQRGLWLGFVSIVLFALTLPMTKMGLGSSAQPYLSPWFMAIGRAAVAGVFAAIYLWYTRAQMPRGVQWQYLVCIALGNGIGFPLLQNSGLQFVSSSHAAVFNGLLPLSTAVVAAVIFRQRAAWAFWGWSGLAAIFVVVFASLRAYAHEGSLSLHWADILILAAVFSAGFGYAYGAKLAQTMPAAQGLCWMLVLLMPLTVPVTVWLLPANAADIPWSAWGAFGYTAIFSMWAGMMLWFHALYIGGAVKVSQVQIFQPFLTILFSIPLLGEPWDWTVVVFAVAVVAAVYMGKRVPVVGR